MEPLMQYLTYFINIIYINYMYEIWIRLEK